MRVKSEREILAEIRRLRHQLDKQRLSHDRSIEGGRNQNAPCAPRTPR